MTVGGALAQRWGGIPLALWILAGATGFYLLMHRQEHGTWASVPVGNPAIGVNYGGELDSFAPPGWATPPPMPIYMPQFPMPAAYEAPEHQGVHY